ncbi:MAG: 3'-5' exoribonuclease [Planctomycetes bacterium]|nr:3'-5' exoribonuclease [Planctomycetota bacterium]
MYHTVVAIDLETSGADPFRDRIIEVGALVIEDGIPTREFSELVNPGLQLSNAIKKLTGITQDMLETARDGDAVLADFLAWMPEDALCIAHNAAFDRQFLRTATREKFRHSVLDTVELSRICFPNLPSHSLAVLSETFGFTNEKTSHRALADCETLAQLWAVILEKADEIPLAVLGEMNRLLAVNPRHPYKDFFGRLAQEKLSQGLGQETEIGALFKMRKTFQPRPPIDGEGEFGTIDAEKVRGWFSADGAFAYAFPGYESREGQVEMALHVTEALNDGRHLMVEAGTGIGKSLAYLAPIVEFALRNETPVIVSTNTKNLQAQLFEKDLPLLRRALGVDFKAALLKGRRNYLCIRKLLYLLDSMETELDGEDRMRLLNILPWAVWSETGDISENIVAGRPHFAPLWGKMSTIGEDCLGRGCKRFRQCFLQRARARAQEADIVVANHSLIFAEIGSKNPALPDYRHLVFDEAHNLEDAATNHLAVELQATRIITAVNRVHRAGRKGSTGLMATLEKSFAAVAGSQGDLAEMAFRRIEDVRIAAGRTHESLPPFFQAIEAALSSRKQGESSRFTQDDKRPAVWDPIRETGRELFAAMAGVLHGIEALANIIRELDEATIPYQMESLRELEASMSWIREITEDATFILQAASNEYVYWLERVGSKSGNVRAVAAPIVVGPLLYDQLYQRKRTVVFCSATMTVRNRFDFLSRRLGIDFISPDRLLTFNAGTPYDYRKQCLVATPVFLPEPGNQGGDYAKELAGFLADVYRRTDGRGMALFTSYDMLSRVADILEKEFVGDGLKLLAQGRSGSRENITAIFKRGERSVLLGTHSFWEGVDVVGDALSCLTIARLPFGVQTDPINEARCEQVESDGGNAFMEYSLPSAVIRFRQGFGRLIRSKTDRGVAIIADRRVVAKRYGQWFRDSIPVPTESYSDREELLEDIEKFLHDTGK